MNKTNKLIKKELERLSIEGVISRKRAVELDELTEGYLFENVIKNAYTEHPSKQQFDITIKALNDFINAGKRYTKEESEKVIEEAIRAVDRLDELTDVEVRKVIDSVIKSDIIKIGVNGKIIPFYELSIDDIPDVLDQLEDIVDSREDRIFMNVFNHASKFREVYGYTKLYEVIHVGLSFISTKPYLSTLDRLRDQFVEQEYVTEDDIGYIFKEPELAIAAIEIARLFNTRLREDIINKFKDQYEIE